MHSLRLKSNENSKCRHVDTGKFLLQPRYPLGEAVITVECPLRLLRGMVVVGDQVRRGEDAMFNIHEACGRRRTTQIYLTAHPMTKDASVANKTHNIARYTFSR